MSVSVLAGVSMAAGRRVAATFQIFFGTLAAVGVVALVIAAARIFLAE